MLTYNSVGTGNETHELLMLFFTIMLLAKHDQHRFKVTDSETQPCDVVLDDSKIG